MNSVHLEYTHNIVNSNIVKWPRSHEVSGLLGTPLQYLSMTTNVSGRQSISKSGSFPRTASILSDLCQPQEEVKRISSHHLEKVGMDEVIEVKGSESYEYNTIEDVHSDSCDEEITVGPTSFVNLSGSSGLDVPSSQENSRDLSDQVVFRQA